MTALRTLSTPSVKVAVFSDSKALVALFKEAHSEYGSATFCPETTRNTVQRAINQPNSGIFILCIDKEIVGALIAVMNQLWYSRERQIADLIYYVKPTARGHGSKLLTAYLGWAREQKHVGEIMLGITSGSDTEGRIATMLQHFSMSPVGANYRLIEDRPHVEHHQENR